MKELGLTSTRSIYPIGNKKKLFCVYKQANDLLHFCANNA
jgi:hypothetical protein